MGMAVKGAGQHRLVRDGVMRLLSAETLTDTQIADAERLLARADMAIARISRRKLARLERAGQDVGETDGTV